MDREIVIPQEFPKEDFHIDYVKYHHGGQSTGLFPKGIKVIHIPSGLSVICESERSQLMNKELAMAKLLIKLIGNGITPSPPSLAP